MIGHLLVVLLALAAVVPGVGAQDACAPIERWTAAASLALEEGRHFDAHAIALFGRTTCDDPTRRRELSLLDARAMLALDELEGARRLLVSLRGDPDAVTERRARWWLALSYLTAGDDAAFERERAAAPADLGARLRVRAAIDDDDAVSAALAQLPHRDRARLRTIVAAYEDADERSPALAGILSAILPGTGQWYAGSFEAAAVAFVLNGVLIGATVELAREKLYFSAAATGLAASVFYVGNIASAVDLAVERNRLARAPHLERLEATLAP